MATVSTYDGALADNPWAGIDTNQRRWYDPVLRSFWKSKIMYSQFGAMTFNTKGLPTDESMEVTSLIMPHADFSEIGFRQLYVNSSRIDSASRTISTHRYGAKMAYHDHDSLITYWRGLEDSQGSASVVAAICQAGLSDMMVEINEALLRNTYLSNPISLYGNGTGQTDFGDIINHGQRLNTNILQNVQLGLMDRAVPFTQGGTMNGTVPAKLLCDCSPGVWQDLKNEASASGNSSAFIDVMKYQNAQRIFSGEMGIYQDTRFIVTPRAILKNCGPIEVRTTITAAHNAGDGVNRAVLVDKTYRVGQKSGIINYIQVASVTGFNLNDEVSLHTAITDDFGVDDGADYREGTKQERRIIQIDAGNNRLVFDRPIMTDFLDDLGGGVYGYVTLGRHIHTSLFLGGLDGVVQGVVQAPRLYNPPAGDDFMSVHRYSFDMRMGYQLWEPTVFEVHFGAGSWRGTGKTVKR